MLFKRDHRRKRRVGIHRIFLSLIMLSILSLGIYQAFKSFSGMDPLSLSPKSVFNSILASDSTSNLIDQLLSFNPKQLIKGKDNSAPTPPALAPKTLGAETSPRNSQATPSPTPKPALLFKFAIVADSENDNNDLSKALSQAKDNGAQFILGLGDYTDVGTVNELSTTKKQFDTVGLKYYLIPGDHDLWDSRNRTLSATYDFNQVFGKDYQSFTYQNVHFLLVNNSDNYDGVSPEQLKFIENDLSESNQTNPKLNLVFVSTPLYHPSSDHVMGRVDSKLQSQAAFLTGLFKKDNVAAVFGGDTHFYSDYTEPSRNLYMVAVGAITAYRNLQGPRYTMVDVYADGSYNIQDTEIK